MALTKQTREGTGERLVTGGQTNRAGALNQGSDSTDLKPHQAGHLFCLSGGDPLKQYLRQRNRDPQKGQEREESNFNYIK